MSLGALKAGLYPAGRKLYVIKLSCSLTSPRLSILIEPSLPLSAPGACVCWVPELGGQWGDQRKRGVSLLWPSLDQSVLERCLGKAFLVYDDVYKKSNKN